jgi:hypothetical protein
MNWQNIDHAFDVKQVRERPTDTTTGRTFLLTDNGLYLIRRPAVEAEKVTGIWNPPVSGSGSGR